MHLLVVNLGLLLVSGQTHAQAPNIWGNLREFVKLQYEPTWTSSIAEASRGNVVIISIP